MIGFLLAGLAASAAGARAQEPPGTLATPFLPAGHWAERAARKVDGLGLGPRGFDAGVRSLRVGEVAWVLEWARLHGGIADEATARLVSGYAARFSEEFGPWVDAVRAELTRAAQVAGGPAPAEDGTRNGGGAQVDGVRSRSVPAAGAFGAGYASRAGGALAGTGYSNVDDWTGPAADPDIEGVRADALLAVGLRPWLAASATPAARASAATLEEATVVVQIGNVGVWGGRRAPGYGPAAGGGVVLSGDRALGGGGLFLTEPVRLPWILRALGPFRAETFLSRIENGDSIRSPWFWGARISFEPAARLRIGVSRGAMFGGDGGSPVTLDKLWLMLRGEHGGDNGNFANQVFALDARYRLPVGVPLVATLEWGMDDLSGAWAQTPALIGGLELAGVPGAPELTLGVERAWFAPAAVGNPMWYRNWAMRDGWTHERRPLGHALAGQGTEWLAYGRLDAAGARVRVDAEARLRERGEENLYAPDRAGRSALVAAGAAWRASRRLDLSVRAGIEDGARDWRVTWLNAGARVLF